VLPLQKAVRLSALAFFEKNKKELKQMPQSLTQKQHVRNKTNMRTL
jgi:hypothetical protein